ncbi:MAG: hypothetical protein PVG71_11690 [Anaerolineae bacterium]
MRKTDDVQELHELLAELDEDMVKSAYASVAFLAALQNASPEAKQWALETVSMCIELGQAPDLSVWEKAVEGWE